MRKKVVVRVHTHRPIGPKHIHTAFADSSAEPWSVRVP